MQFSEDQASAYDAVADVLKRAGINLDDAVLMPESDGRQQTLAILGKAGSGKTMLLAKIAEALGCRTSTVERVRQRFVECGFEQTLHGKKRAKPPVEKILDGNQEAKVIAMRLGDPPKGFGKWTLRLLARKVVELKIVESISYQTVRRTLKKTK